MSRKYSGFTLIELVVVITIIGLAITLATPSWDVVSQKRKLTNATEQVASLLVVAQSEAQKRNQAVSLAFSRSGNQSKKQPLLFSNRIFRLSLFQRYRRALLLFTRPSRTRLLL